MEQWTEIETAVRSVDPDRVNDAIDRIESMDRKRRGRLFDAGLDDLASIYRESDDGYVRQSVVRTIGALSPGLGVALSLGDGNDDADETRAAIKRRLDAATGFLIEAIHTVGCNFVTIFAIPGWRNSLQTYSRQYQDEDGRVRQAAKRALESAYRGYGGLEETDTVAALVAELEELAGEYDDKRRDHILDSKKDAEFRLRPAGTRMIENIKRIGENP